MTGSGSTTFQFTKWTSRFSKFIKGLSFASELMTPLVGYELYEQEKLIHEKRIIETITAEIKIRGLEEIKFTSLYIHPSTGELFEFLGEPLNLKKINISLSSIPGHEGLFYSKEHRITIFKPEFESKSWRIMDFPNN